MTKLRQPGRVLLVSCYENGHVPHGLALPMGFLVRAGYEPVASDLSIDQLQDETIDRARVAIISAGMHTAMRLGVRVAERIRARNPHCIIGFAGLYATMNRDYLRAFADWTFAGEYERDLLAQLDALDAGVPPTAIPSTSLTKLDFPVPIRQGLPSLDHYAKLARADERRVTGYTETTRGCRDTCAHCPVPAVYRGRLFAVPREVVLQDIATQVSAGAAHITFGDPDFLNGPKHGLRILRDLHQRWPELSFDITAQVTHLLEQSEHLEEIAELGCAFVVTAIESLSDVVLEHLRKRHRRSQVIRAIAKARAAGLVLRPTFVPFTPWTTVDDMRELLSFIESNALVHHVSPIQLTIRLLVPPGSLLLEHDGTRHSFGALDEAALTHRWIHPDPRVDSLQVALADCATRAAAEDRPDYPQTFAAMRELVWSAAGLTAPPMGGVATTAAVPRLTEPWFC